LAIRGGGGNFGVITEFEYRLHPISEMVTGNLIYRFEDAVRVLELYGEFMATAPDDFHANVTLNNRVSVAWRFVIAATLQGQSNYCAPGARWRRRTQTRSDARRMASYCECQLMERPIRFHSLR